MHVLTGFGTCCDILKHINKVNQRRKINHEKVTTLKDGTYIAGYLVEKDDLKIAWIKTASSDSNLIDHVAVCAELTFDKMIFIGAVGALKPEFELGDLCTPSFSIAGGFAHTYLKDSIKDFVPFERVEPDMEFINNVVGIAEESGYELYHTMTNNYK